MEGPTLRDIYKAKKTIAPHLARTPLQFSPGLSEVLEANVYLKHDEHLPLGAFKARGGINLLAHMSAEERGPLALGSREFFLGLINKAEYRFELGRVQIEPRWKSEFRNQTYDLFSNRERRELTEIVGTIFEFPMLSHSVISVGIEYVRFSDLDSDVNDFQSFIAAGQLTNVSEYQGYQLTTQAGLKHDLRDFEDPSIRTRSVTEGFITVYAGLGTP